MKMFSSEPLRRPTGPSRAKSQQRFMRGESENIFMECLLGMKFLMHVAKLLVCNMRIYLCGCDVRMTEHHLDGANIGSV